MSEAEKIVLAEDNSTLSLLLNTSILLNILSNDQGNRTKIFSHRRL